MSAHDVPGWYEEGLPLQERKRRGHFSTPPQLVEQILDACGYIPERPLAALRVLDPACGSGNFLVAAARRLLLSGQQQDLSSDRTLLALGQNLWGFDPDPVACFLAEMQLRTLCASWLATDNTPALHIHQGDGLALPWQDYQGVDLFLANPPYLAAKNTDLSGYSSARQRGQADSYLLFMSLALQIVRPDGWLALVLPDPVLARANATRERLRLLSETTIHHLWHLSGVFSAQVGAVVIIAQKRVPTHTHSVPWLRGHWLHARGGESRAPVKQAGVEAGKEVPLTLLLKRPRGELCYLLGEVQNPLLRELSTRFHTGKQGTLAPLDAFVQIRRGEELSKDSPLLQLDQPEGEPEQVWYPVLRGGSDVRSCVPPQGRAWLAQTYIRKPLERYLLPKIVVVKSTGYLQATLDLQGHVVLQTLYLLNLRTTSPFRPVVDEVALQSSDRIHGPHDAHDGYIDELYFLLALLSSRFLKEYVYVLHTAYKWVQPQIEQHVLANLPVPTILPTARAAIAARAREMYACGASVAVVELEQRRNALYEQQEQAICALYTAALEEALVLSSS